MLTVRQILNVTPKKTKDRSKLVTLIRVKKALVYNGASYYIVSCKTDKQSYDTNVVLFTDKPITKSNLPRLKVWFSCSCGDFVYRCEHYLAKHGSSAKIHTHGVNPGEGMYEVNPQGIPWTCKHCVAVLKEISRIKIKEGKMPLSYMVKLHLPEAEKRVPRSQRIPRTKPNETKPTFRKITKRARKPK